MKNAPQGQKQRVAIDQKKMMKPALIAAFCIIVLLSGLGALAYGYGGAYESQVFKGVKISGMVVEGLSPAEAEAKLALFVQKELGVGSLSRKKGVNAYILTINSYEGILLVISLICFKLRNL